MQCSQQLANSFESTEIENIRLILQHNVAETIENGLSTRDPNEALAEAKKKPPLPANSGIQKPKIDPDIHSREITTDIKNVFAEAVGYDNFINRNPQLRMVLQMCVS